jgi:wyosine [tRNA(Phe)-imidazoG37] synthetase (radical SAM superfamily)
VYCQVGPTPVREIEPRSFWSPGTVAEAVTHHIDTLRARNERVDYLTFVPDGEPTLDCNLGLEIDALRPLGLPIAVISNGSLVWRTDVRAALGKADWVSLKVDSVVDTTWQAINRPQPSLALATLQDGMSRFAADFQGELATETMLVSGVNDDDASIDATAAFVEQLRPRIAYIAVPTRPPAEPWVQPPSEETINRAYQRFAERLPRVELLAGFEGTGFGTTGDVARDLLSITAVHPMREDAVLALLARNKSDRTVLDQLVADGALRPVTWQNRIFFVRRFS